MQLEEVRRNYDRAARHYDRMTDIVFGRVLGVEALRERAVELLGELEGATVLDLGCGTGRDFPLLVPRVGVRGRIIGFDYSDGMLAQARERIRAAGWTQVELVQGDAAELTGVSAAVDDVLAVWCLGIVHDLDAALERAVEVLRPGGRLVVMDFFRARPDRGPLRWLAPLWRPLLAWSGVSAPEDLDDDRLRAKWQRGRGLLRERLADVHEETYLDETGFILAGRKPS